jgi:hypothetical protein
VCVEFELLEVKVPIIFLGTEGQGLYNAIYDSSMVSAHHFPPRKVPFLKFTYASYNFLGMGRSFRGVLTSDRDASN